MAQSPASIDNQQDPRSYLQSLTTTLNAPLSSPTFSSYLDSNDPFKDYRSKFCIPLVKDIREDKETEEKADGNDEVIYFCGNSLGLRPKDTERIVSEELKVWAKRGVHGHFSHPHNRPWVSIDETVVSKCAKIVGALPQEVAIMNTLTGNLHLLMVSFYRPTPDRYKIIIEDKAFPSDHYAVESQVRFHGFDPKDAMVLVKPREGEHILRMEDILQTIEKEGDKTALVMFSGVQYYTGQLFDLRTITKTGHKKGCYVGFDLAHAVGNVPLQLHDWDVDFACWCTYKYLNAGPGGIAGAFVHEKFNNVNLPRFAGWWGHEKETRFQMNNEFQPMPGAAGYQLSNPNVLATVSLLGSLNIFDTTTISQLHHQKSRLLTTYLELLITSTLPSSKIQIITPHDLNQRGCQLSLLIKTETVKPIMDELVKRGVVVDEREPNVIRVAPTPLYNRFDEVRRFVGILEKVFKIVGI